MQQIIQNRERMTAAGQTFPLKLRCGSIDDPCKEPAPHRTLFADTNLRFVVFK